MKNKRTSRFWRTTSECMLASGALAVLTFVSFRFHAGPSMAAVLFFFLVILTSLWAGLAATVFACVVAALCFIYFFTQPLYSLTRMSEPMGIVALIAFPSTALIISRLLSRVRERTAELQQTNEQLQAEVAERSRAEQKIRQSEAEFRRLIDAIPQHVVVLEPDGSLRYINQVALEYSGVTKEDSFAKDALARTYHPDDLERVLGERRNAISRGAAAEVEARIRGADGKYRWFLIRINPLRDEQGRILRWYGTRTDIEDRKQAEDALRQSEAYLAEAQRLSHTGSWAFDLANDKYVYVSEECARIFELDAPERLWPREAISRQIHPEDWDRVKGSFEKSVREKVDTSSEFRITPPSGAVKHVHTIRHPVMNDAGDVVKLVGTVIDITERKRAEEALRESETRFRTFVDHAADAFFILDFEEETIIDVNRCACESLGCAREELIGMTPLAFDVSLNGATLDASAERAAAGETVLFDQHWHRRKDGSLFPVEVQTSVLWHGGRRFLLKVARDITDRVRAEEQRDRLRQLEADLAHINRVSMMGELAASVAHEVNQPLSAVVVNGNACLRWLAGDSPNLDEAREAVRRIVRDGKRAGDVIARIRALATKTATAKGRLDMNEAIWEVMALTEDELRKNSVAVQTEFAPDLLPVLGDQVQLQQVVLNMIMNGIEAMSSVEERPRELIVRTRNDDAGQVRITVKDSGMGLDLQSMERIFDAFYTTKPGGLGMGLSISRSIIQNHGGKLWAVANEGPGISVQFTIPNYQ
jgi:PAS domain S-box-containing protein